MSKMPLVVRCAVGFGAIIALSAADVPPRSFCQRLAPELKMKPVWNPMNPSKVNDHYYSIDLLGDLRHQLFGGATSVIFSVRPLGDDPSLEEAKRFDGACVPTAKGAVCKVSGPARLKVRTKDRDLLEPANEGERATVEMRRTKIFCRDEIAS